MTEISLDIPINGSFSTSPTFLDRKHDLIQLSLNRFVGYVHQESSPLGYVCIFDFVDFINSNTAAVTKQKLLYFNDTPAARMWKIADDRVLYSIRHIVFVALKPHSFRGVDTGRL